MGPLSVLIPIEFFKLGDPTGLEIGRPLTEIRNELFFGASSDPLRERDEKNDNGDGFWKRPDLAWCGVGGSGLNGGLIGPVGVGAIG